MARLRHRMIRKLELQRKSRHTNKACVTAASQLVRHYDHCRTVIFGR